MTNRVITGCFSSDTALIVACGRGHLSPGACIQASFSDASASRSIPSLLRRVCSERIERSLHAAGGPRLGTPGTPRDFSGSVCYISNDASRVAQRACTNVQRARVRPRASACAGRARGPAGRLASGSLLSLDPALVPARSAVRASRAPLLSLLVAPSARRLSSAMARAHHRRRGTLRARGNGVTRRGIPLPSPRPAI